MDCSVIILAAGRSGRMGKPKFALRYNDEMIFLEEVVSQFLTFGCGEIVIVLNDEGYSGFQNLNIAFPENIKIEINHHPEKGRFFSLQIGLSSLNSKRYVFVHNVDNPFVTQRDLGLLFNGISGYDFCVPVYEGRGGHPVLLSETVIDGILSENDVNITLRDIMKRYYGKRVEAESDKILVNINTVEDYREFFE